MKYLLWPGIRQAGDQYLLWPGIRQAGDQHLLWPDIRQTGDNCLLWPGIKYKFLYLVSYLSSIICTQYLNVQA